MTCTPSRKSPYDMHGTPGVTAPQIDSAKPFWASPTFRITYGRCATWGLRRDSTCPSIRDPRAYKADTFGASFAPAIIMISLIHIIGMSMLLSFLIAFRAIHRASTQHGGVYGLRPSCGRLKLQQRLLWVHLVVMRKNMEAA